MNTQNPDYTPNCLSFDSRVDTHQPIYRVTTVDRLTDLIEKRANILVHPSKWDDPFENYFLKSKFRYNGMSVGVDQLRSEIFGQCWTLNQQETDALWRIYSPDKNGVRIKSTIDKVFRPLVKQHIKYWYASTYFGKVTYVQQQQLSTIMKNYVLDAHDLASTDGQVIIDSLLIKREAFKHENEVRVIYRGKPNLDDGMHSYEINPQDFIKELLFDPRMDEKEYQGFENQFKKLLPVCPISQSDLYRGPDYTIEIKD